jgi:hypothetical protein
MDSGASGRGSNTEHAGGSLNRTVNPGRLLEVHAAISRVFYSGTGLIRLVRFRVRLCFRPLRFRRRAGRRHGMVLFRLLTESLPALEGERLFALPKARKIEAAVLASPFPCPQRNLKGYPKRWIRVRLTCPAIQVHALATRALGAKKVGPNDGRREKTQLAIQTSVRSNQAQLPELLGKVARPGRTQITASTFRAGGRHGSDAHRSDPH